MAGMVKIIVKPGDEWFEVSCDANVAFSFSVLACNSLGPAATPALKPIPEVAPTSIPEAATIE